jgi:hypothetical protein
MERLTVGRLGQLCGDARGQGDTISCLKGAGYRRSMLPSRPTYWEMLPQQASFRGA